MRRLHITGLVLLVTCIAAPAEANAAAEYSVSSSGDNASIRNGVPGSVGMGYVVGVARNGVTIDIQYKTSSSGWGFGYVWGNFKHCGWVYMPNLRYVGSGVASRCPNGPSGYYQYPLSSFNNGEVNCQPGTCSDGSTAHINYNHTNCTMPGAAFANVNPFKAWSGGRDYYGPLPDNAYVLWRYTSRDGNWTMIRDPNYLSRGFVGRNGGPPSNWYFVRRNCINLF